MVHKSGVFVKGTGSWIHITGALTKRAGTLVHKAGVAEITHIVETRLVVEPVVAAEHITGRLVHLFHKIFAWILGFIREATIELRILCGEDAREGIFIIAVKAERSHARLVVVHKGVKGWLRVAESKTKARVCVVESLVRWCRSVMCVV